MDRKILTAAALTTLMFSSAALADVGDRIEDRFDERGDRIEDRLDDRGDRIN